MAALLKEILATFDRWPIVQSAVAFLVLIVGIVMLRNGLAQKPPPIPVVTPQGYESGWLNTMLNSIFLEVQKIELLLKDISHRLRRLEGEPPSADDD